MIKISCSRLIKLFIREVYSKRYEKEINEIPLEILKGMSLIDMMKIYGKN
jgi:hypothetical protein